MKLACLNKQLFINHECPVCTISIFLWRYTGLVVSVFTSASGSLGLIPGWRHCGVFLGKTLYSYSAFLLHLFLVCKWVLSGLTGVYRTISRLMKQAG